MKVKVRSVVLDSISFRSTQCTLEMDQIQLLFKEIAREAFSFTHINLHSSLYRLYQSQKGRNKNSYMCKYIFSKWMQRACTHKQSGFLHGQSALLFSFLFLLYLLSIFSLSDLPDVPHDGGVTAYHLRVLLTRHLQTASNFLHT